MKRLDLATLPVVLTARLPHTAGVRRWVREYDAAVLRQQEKEKAGRLPGSEESAENSCRNYTAAGASK